MFTPLTPGPEPNSKIPTSDSPVLHRGFRRTELRTRKKDDLT